MKRVLKAVAAAVLAVLVLIALKNEFARLLPASTYGMGPAVKMGEIDNLFIGSSMFRQGLDIDVLEEETDGTCYILSYNGNQPAFIAMELEYMLDEGLEIENLYIDLYPYTAAADVWISDTKILLDTDLSFKIEAWKLMSANSETTAADFYEFFVTANNEQILTWPLNNRLVSPQFRNGGSTLKASGSTAEELEELEGLGSRDGLVDAQVEGYRTIAELCAADGINLYFIETPKYAKMYSDEDYTELLEACVSVINDIGAGWESDAAFEVILSEDLDFDNTDASNFQDLIHLSYEGRKSYSRLLAEEIG